MASQFETVQKFLTSLREGTPASELLTEDVVFTALAVNVPGREAVLARMTAPDTGRPYQQVTWEPPTMNRGAVQMVGRLPAGSPSGGVILQFLFKGDEISVVQQQAIPGTPAPFEELEMPAQLMDLVNHALEHANPMVVAYMSEEGQPILSFRGSTCAISGTTLGLWARNSDGFFLQCIERNPRISFVYRDEEKRATFMFYGRARVATDDTTRDLVYDTMPQVERDHDYARTGSAVIVDLDRVEGGFGTGGGPRIRMMRGAGAPAAVR